MMWVSCQQWPNFQKLTLFYSVALTCQVEKDCHCDFLRDLVGHMILPNSCERDLWSRKWESHEPDTKFAKLSWIETFVGRFKKKGAWFYISNC